MGNGDLEIYRQRYETFRHLDRLRWQMLQLLIAVGSAFALTIRATNRPADWWLFFAIGGSLAIISWIIFKINHGIRANGIILQKVGEKIGDTGIPDTRNALKSSAHWLAILIALLAIFFFSLGVLKLWKIL